MPGITISTIGDLIDNDMWMTAWCPTCKTNVPIDLHRLAEKYGRDESYIVSKTRIRITHAVCGTKSLSRVIGARR